MLHDEILDYIERNTYAGQAELAHTVRMLLYRKAPAQFEHLDFNDDAAFLEPALFVSFTMHASDIGIDQALYATLPEDARPASFGVLTDAHGRAHLPRYGYITGLAPHGHATVRRGSADGTFQAGGTTLGFVPSRYAADQLEATHAVDAIIRPLFAAAPDPDTAALSDADAAALWTTFGRAVTLMKKAAPRIHDLLLLANRRVQLYRSPAPNSFATLSAHGTAFLNVPADATAVFFLDDLAHQGGHVVFNAATIDTPRYLRLPAHTPMREIGPDTADTRGLYAAFHGLFTYSLIVSVLHACLVQHVFTGREAHELRGRLAFYLLKFQIDLRNLGRSDLFTPEGEYLYEAFYSCHDRVLHNAYDRVRGLDLSNQPYTFDYELFAQLNPGLAH